MTSCSICQTPIEKSFCPTCGQRALGRRATLTNLAGDALENLFYLEKSVFGTLIRLIRAPKKVVDYYYEGFRNYFASPGKFLLYAIAVLALHLAFVNKYILGLQLEVENIAAQYFFWLFHLPIVIALSFLAFIRRKQPIAKHAIASTYLACGFLMICITGHDILILLFGDFLDNFAYVIYMLLFFIWNARVFSPTGRPLSVVGYTAIQIIVYTAFVLFLVWVTS